jgi:hypothetical protein
MAEPLPPTDVSVSTDMPKEGTHRTTVTVKRSGANAGTERSWTGEADTASGATREAVKKMLGDPVTGEFIG